MRRAASLLLSATTPASSCRRCALVQRAVEQQRASKRPFSSSPPTRSTDTITADGKTVARDSWTNATPTILAKVGRNLHLQPSHPIGILRALIEAHFSSFQTFNTISPVVTVQQNFDDLGFAPDHPGRSLTDTYYLNKEVMLRTHTSAHEVETFSAGAEKWLLAADVYRRDEIDASHYPVFHQMEGAYVMPKDGDGLRKMAEENREMEKLLDQENIVIEDPTKEVTATNPYQAEHRPEDARVISDHLKNSLNTLVLSLFGPIAKAQGQKLQVRWIEATFPWTQPSYEMEVMFNGKWLELLGSGQMRQEALARSGVPNKMGWAFGLGLERWAMVLFSIPDIRLFWSTDARFSSQFKEGTISTFKPYSKHPPCYKDFSFWVPKAPAGNQAGGAVGKEFHENDFCEIVRNVAGDLVETVERIDDFTHPKTGERSMCYRMNYRSMDRSLENEAVNKLQAEVVEQVVQQMGVRVR